MTDIEPITSVPVLRRLWLVILLTCLILTFPLAMIILLSGPVYRWRENGWQPIGNGPRYVYGGILALWLMAAVGKAILVPGSVSQDWAKSANPDQPSVQAPQAANSASGGNPAISTSGEETALSSCTSNSTIEAVKEVLNGMDEVMDFGKEQETWFDAANNQRRCAAMAALKSGQTIVTYQVYRGPSGKELVQVQTGDKAFMQHEVDKANKEEAESEPQKASPPDTDSDTSGNVKADNYEK